MSILKELAKIYRVRKSGNPYRDEDGQFSSKDNAETTVMDVASNIKNKKMTDKDWEKVNEIGLDLTDSDIVDLESGGVEKIDEMVKNQLKENEELLSKTTDKDAKDLLIKQIAKLKQYSKAQKSELAMQAIRKYQGKAND